MSAIKETTKKMQDEITKIDDGLVMLQVHCNKKLSQNRIKRMRRWLREICDAECQPLGRQNDK